MDRIAAPVAGGILGRSISDFKMDMLESGGAFATVANEVSFRDNVIDIDGPVRHVEVVRVVTASTVRTAAPVTRAVVP